MNKVYKQRVKRRPDDATGVFAGKLKQMEIIDYPGYMKHAIYQYYQLIINPTLH